MYSQALASAMMHRPEYSDQLDENMIALIRQASPLHDIGKIAIPRDILSKPGPLTDDERRRMMEHTILGGEALEEALIDFPRAMHFKQVACDIAQTHHEKFDGSGYPYGLAGEEIPLAGRIVSVCDVYDALTSNRVYKSAWTHDRTLDYIHNESGRSFDPQIVLAWDSVKHAFAAIRHSFPDGEPMDLSGLMS